MVAHCVSHSLIKLKSSSKDMSQVCVMFARVEQKPSKNAQNFPLQEFLVKRASISPNLLNEFACVTSQKLLQCCVTVLFL